MFLLANNLATVGVNLTRETLLDGKNSLDAVEAGVRALEGDVDSPFVGLGGEPNLLGVVQCDAGLMNGSTMQIGAVGALTGFRHPVSVARKVLELLPHVLIVGDGAARFAKEIKAEPAKLLTDSERERYNRWLTKKIPAEMLDKWPDVDLVDHAWQCTEFLGREKDTVTFLAMDSNGMLSAGTSTTGWCYKYPGRIGDSPIPGAGFYADSQVGGCTCTYTGEMALRASASRAVVAFMKKGATPKEACHDAVDDVTKLDGGFIDTIVIHAANKDGETHVVCASDSKDVPVPYWYWNSDLNAVEERNSELVKL